MASPRLKVAIIVGLLLGVVFLVEGGLELLKSLTETGTPPVATRYGPVSGTLDEILGFVLLFAGISTIGAILGLVVWRWEGGDDEELPDD